MMLTNSFSSVPEDDSAFEIGTNHFLRDIAQVQSSMRDHVRSGRGDQKWAWHLKIFRLASLTIHLAPPPLKSYLRPWYLLHLTLSPSALPFSLIHVHVHKYMHMYRYMNNHVHSAPQSKKEENREERKKNHTL